MAQHADILDQPESLRNSFIVSLLFHAAVIAGFVLLAIAYESHRELWGTPTPSGGGAVAISPIKTIPLPPRQGRPNPVANDTESVVPPAPKQETPKEKVKAPEPDAIPIKSKKQEKPEKTQAS